LPYHELSDKRFEELCLWLVRREGYERAEHLGASGSEQGRDIVAWREGVECAFQCKRVRRFGPKDALAEAEKMLALPEDQRPAVLVFIAACNISKRTRQETRAYCAGKVECQFWGVTELQERVKRHPDIVEEFFQLPGAPSEEIPPPLHQLRAPVATFTGRGKELKDIPAHLAADGGGAALIAGLTGMGGVGKTELAYAVADRLGEDYPDAQLVVDLKGTTEPVPPERALAQVVHAFAPEARLPDDLEALRGHYCSLLTGKRVLLLLDDAAGASQLSPLLEVPPGVGVLVTSRRRLALRGLRRWDVDLLPLEEAVELLRKTAPSRKDVDEATWKHVAKLCGRLPLALRVAGATLETTPDLDGAAYAARLADEKRRLATLRLEDDPEGDVGATLGLSVARLEAEDPEQTARWTLLGLIPPASFDAALAAGVWGRAVEGEEELPRLVPLEEAETRETLHTLARRNLVDWDGKARRYTLHELLRVYARDRAEEQLDAGNVDAVRLRHALYALDVAHRSDELYVAGGEDCVVGLALLDDILPHLRAAVAWAREGAAGGGMQARLAMLLPDAAPYSLDLRLAPREKIGWLEGAVAAACTLGHRGFEGVHLGNLGLAYAALGEARRAIRYHEQALEIAREIGDRHGEGAELGGLGTAYAALGDARRAIGYYEQTLEIAREIGDRRNEGADLGNLGLAYRALGEARRAIGYHEQALEIARQIGDRRNEGAHLGNLGLAHADLGDARRALGYYEQALEIAREIGDRRGEGANLGNLGSAYADLGEVRRAIGYHEQALEIAREIGDRRGEGNQLGNLGGAYYHLGEARRAIGYHEQALEIAREIGDRRMEGIALNNLGLLAHKQGDFARAREMWEKALRIYEAIEDPNAERVRGWLAELGQSNTGVGTQ
jgi:tetratricopeptide (TPR) repeat protein